MRGVQHAVDRRRAPAARRDRARRKNAALAMQDDRAHPAGIVEKNALFQVLSVVQSVALQPAGRVARLQRRHPARAKRTGIWGSFQA